ncbi:MAG: ATP-binding protein [Pseudomonadota bacterium]|nr:ATP-binding protein [Pseudomonadota bacterium]
MLRTRFNHMTVYNLILRQQQHTKTFAFFIILIFSLLAYVASTHFMPKLGVLLILQLAIVVISMPCNRVVTNVSCFIFALIYNYFFTLPHYSFHMTELEDIINTIVFLVVSFLTSDFSNRYREKSEALKQAEMRSNILLSVSHDLRTPLSSIIGSLETFKEYQHQISDEKKAELIDGSIEESHRLHRYIENLLQLVKLKHSPVELKMHKHRIEDITQHLESRVANPRFKMDINVSQPIMVQDALLEQAIYNMVDNALRYSPADKPVILKAYDLEQLLYIQVMDYGEGIPKQHRDQIFDAFYSSRTGDMGYGGSGLGLAVAKGIVDAHRGRVHVIENVTDDEGTQFGCVIEIQIPVGLTHE